MNANHIAIIRGVLMLLAVLFRSNTIPTGVEGMGERIADGLMTLAVTLAAGDRTPAAVKDATQAVREAQAEGRL